ARIELATCFEPGTPNVRADATQIHQVMINLGTNAMHAIGDNTGKIEISVGAASIDRYSATGNLLPGDYARIKVRDTGSGMRAEVISRIFDPFFTTKPSGAGTGLGLSVVSGIIKAHSGSILVSSTPGQGSSFELYFSAVSLGVDSPRETQRSPVSGRGETILLLDDEAALLKSVSRLLEKLGYRVTTFSRPADAIAAAQTNPESFDVLITDFNMPAMSGLDVAKEILRIRPQMPIALASGHVTEDLRAKALALGIREIVYKPVAIEEMAAVIQRLLAQNDVAKI
ncbi:MAG: response regulator, partial [Burkholderiales bacterium]